MLCHAECGGELHKPRKSSKAYRCKECREEVYVGGGKPIGVNESNSRAGRGITTHGVRTYYEIPPAKENESMSLHTSLVGGGGKILVIGGTMNPNWAEHAKHPQVVFWTGDRHEIQRHLKATHNLPVNCKAVLISKFIGHAEAGKIIEEARSKRALIINSLNDGELTAKLKEILTPPNGQPVNAVHAIRTTEVIAELKPVAVAVRATSVKTDLRPMKRNELSELVAAHYDGTLPNIDNANRIHDIITQKGISTTVASIGQAIYQLKKKTGLVSPIARASRGKRLTNVPADDRGKTFVTPTPLPAMTPAPMPVVMPAPIPTMVAKAKVVSEDELIEQLDDAIAGLQLVREQVIEFRGQRNDYLRLKAKLANLLKEE